jgi:hypothetical protein
MAEEIAQVAAEVAPFVIAYGAAVAEKAKDDLADATVGVGKKLAGALFHRKKDDGPLPEVVVKAAGNPGDGVVQGALQYLIREALESNAQVLAEVREILAEAGKDESIHAGGHVFNVKAGRDSYISGRDQTIYQGRD